MTAKVFRAAEVCDRAQLQPYVLRLWEKEFPGIGLSEGDGPRVYREADIEQVLRIKQLVFGEGLTLAGARRRLEGDVPPAPGAPAADLPALVGPEAKQRIGAVRDGLRSLLALLDARPLPFALAAQASPAGSLAPRERAGAKRGQVARSTKGAATPARRTTKAKTKRASA